MPEVSAAKPRRSAKRATAKSQPALGAVSEEAPKIINMTALDRSSMIAEAAYYRAQGRQFEPGHDLEDWLAAEREIDGALIARAGTATTA